MTITEARKLYEKYKKEISWDNNHENEGALIEVTEFLLKETNDPWYSSDLGSFYYSRKQFDLAQKYYEMTYDLGEHDIAVCLGYIWYYGRTGTVDYEKAFRYFSEAADLGNSEAKRKLADMYKNGYYVEQDYLKYRQMIEELYEEHKNDEHGFIELPDICTRLAKIRKEEGNVKEAVHLYQTAKELLPIRMHYTEFFGDINVMEWLVNDLYELIEPDYSDLDIFDLFYVLKKPAAASFYWNQNRYVMRSVVENGEYEVTFNDHWYRAMNDLFQNAHLNGKPLYVRCDEIYNVRINHGRNHKS
ncbi:MAG: sel1 repeat family protein [Solobacterium sp.]|nr:sel1 repeat family protein [Solobacterium sp.]